MNSARPALPRFLFPLMLLGGPLAALPFLVRGYSQVTRLLFVLGGTAGPALIVWKAPAWWLLLAALLAFNLPFSVYALSRLMGARREPRPALWPAFRLACAAACGAMPLAVVWASLEQWLADLLWSRYYPVNASVAGMSDDLSLLWSTLVGLLFFAALRRGQKGGLDSLARFASLCLLVFGMHLVFYQALLIGVVVPLWQAESLELFPSWLNRFRAALFIFLWLCVATALAGAWEPGAGRKRVFAAFYGRALASGLLAMTGLALATGLPVNYALLLGQHFEKQGTTAWAVPCYAKALDWCQSPALKSYLQFRMGLLHRKNGNIEAAKEAFVRVLIKYHHQSRLLLEAHDFKEKLEKNTRSGLRRVVIPGIEARTEYKSAYCVPNSLGLVLNYWGDRAGAKAIGAEITQLEEGSLMIDEIFFAESRGFRNLVLPLRSLSDIFRLIDADIPVLAFIPGHVLAVFGYDEVLQTLVTYDVNTYDIWDDQRWTEFGADWCRLYNTLGIVVPEGKYPLVLDILGEDAEAQSEAYLQYLIAHGTGTAMGEAVAHLRRAGGKGLHFPDWEYQYWTGVTLQDTRRDSAMAAFLLSHQVYESQLLEYVRSLYQRGGYRAAVDFIQSHSRAKRLSSSMAMLLAGCLHKLGEREIAFQSLLQRGDVEDLDPVALDFLLRQPEVQGNGQAARALALKMLDRAEAVPAWAARQAYWTWRRNTHIDHRNIDEALARAEDYLSLHNPYDSAAISDLIGFFPVKQFREDDERSRRSWEKKIRIMSARLEAGEWP